MDIFRDQELEKEITDALKVADQFELYLQKSNLKQSEISDVQYIETRRAFYAGFGQMTILLVTKIADVPEEQGVRIMDGFMNEVNDFFQKEFNF